MSKLKAFLGYLRTRPKAIWAFAKRRPKTAIVLLIVLLLLLRGIMNAGKPKDPEYITDVAIRDDLVQVVEAVGEVISERDLKLAFPITGVVSEVNVDEGDEVKAGDVLAKLRSSGLYADVQSAQAQVASARAELDKLEEGTRPEEIRIAEVSVENKRASLEAARESLRTAENNLLQSEQKLAVLVAETETSLGGFVGTAQSDISQHLSTALTAIRVMDDVLNDFQLLDVIIKHEPDDYNRVRRQIDVATAHVEAAMRNRPAVTDYKDALVALESARADVAELTTALNGIYSIISTLPITPFYTNTEKEASKSSVATQRSNVQSALTSLDASIKALRDASANFDTRISAEEATLISNQGLKDRALADIRTFETSLNIEEANLALSRAGSRPADIAAARARLNQAYAQLRRAQERFDDTIIYAPIDGRITQVSLKEGELLSTSFASEAAVTMLGESPFRIEMFVSEIDIPKVKLSHSGAIELDAFADDPFAISVSEIDPAATLVDGVSKYRVKLDFSDNTDALKIGMSGDAEIYTDRRDDVIIIPGRAVIRQDDGSDMVRVLVDETIEERTVEIGIDGEGGDVEVVSGINEDDTVVVLVKE